MHRPEIGRTLAYVLLLWGLTTATAGAQPLEIAAALDRPAIAPVLAAFERANPDIALHYADLSTRAVEARLHDRRRPPDVVISSAMPAQLAAANAGYAQRLAGPVVDDWPAAFKWRNAVFGFTFEPVVFAYRCDRLARNDVPRSHGALYRTLTDRPEVLGHGRLALYDPSASAVGYALYQADAGYTARFWQLVAAFGKAGARPVHYTRDMLEGLSRGRFVFAYNLIGSYAMNWAATHPHIAVVIPRDYALVLSRMIFVHRRAPHPDAAQRFVNFILSRHGQTVLAARTRLYSPRTDIHGAHTAARLKAAAGRRLMPIALDAGLLALEDPARRAVFLSRWQAETAASTAVVPLRRADRPTRLDRHRRASETPTAKTIQPADLASAATSPIMNPSSSCPTEERPSDE